MKRILALLSVVLVTLSLSGAVDSPDSSISAQFDGVCYDNGKATCVEGLVSGDVLGNLECYLQPLVETEFGACVYFGQGTIRSKLGTASTLDTFVVFPTKDPGFQLWYGSHVVSEPNGCETLLYSEGFAIAPIMPDDGDGIWQVYLDLEGFMMMPIAEDPGFGE